MPMESAATSSTRRDMVKRMMKREVKSQSSAYFSRSRLSRTSQMTKPKMQLPSASETSLVQSIWLGFPDEQLAAHGVDHQRQGDLQHVVGGFPSGDGGVPGEPAAHQHRHLHDAQPASGRRDDRFHLGVVVGVVAGEQLDGLLAVAAETGGGVLDGVTGEKLDQAVKDPGAEPAGDPHLVAAGQGARADDQVGLAPPDQLGDLEDLVAAVLAVAVELDGEVVAPLAGELEAGLDRAADAQVEGVGNHVRAQLFGHQGGVVARAVVHHQQVAAKRPEILEYRMNVLGFVICRDYGENLHFPSQPASQMAAKPVRKPSKSALLQKADQ